MASLIGVFNSYSAWWNYVTLTLNRGQEQEASWRNQYNYLRAYYLSNGLYDVLRETFRDLCWPVSEANMTPLTVDVVLDNVERYLVQKYAERQPVTVEPLREDAIQGQWRTDAIVLAVIVLAYAAGCLTAWGMGSH